MEEGTVFPQNRGPVNKQIFAHASKNVVPVAVLCTAVLRLPGIAAFFRDFFFSFVFQIEKDFFPVCQLWNSFEKWKNPVL